MMNEYIEEYLTSLNNIEPLFDREPITLLCGEAFLRYVENKSKLDLESKDKLFRTVYHAAMDDTRVSGILAPGTFYPVSSYFPLVVRANATIEHYGPNPLEVLEKHKTIKNN